jgi:type I restriction enzyme S subunit
MQSTPSWPLNSIKTRFTGQLFAYANRLEARYNSARAQVEKLTPSLLAKTFRCVLVPQAAND